ncbi:MAG: hypothetical protein U5K79_00870 [Cyclobacteriaceae bacterium]|nr:hypothetical protein [Cyclobacteriaceae bacterium]
MAAPQRKRKSGKLQNFDSELWIADKNGCAGTRVASMENLLAAKHLMRGLQTNEIVELLGKPDAEELYDRSQKYYIYFMEPGPKCETPKEKPRALYVRFSAVGLANEFVIQPF